MANEPIKKTLPNGTQEWSLNGLLHREDGPAVIRPDGAKVWWQNGLRHREDGPAVIWPDGTQEWWLNGQLHREDGPAFIGADGAKAWWQNDKRHREDGPAYIRPDGTQEWWQNGKQVDPPSSAEVAPAEPKSTPQWDFAQQIMTQVRLSATRPNTADMHAFNRLLLGRAKAFRKGDPQIVLIGLTTDDPCYYLLETP
jgi:hypothetical protein